MIPVIIRVGAVIIALICFLLIMWLLARRYHWHPEWQRKILHVGLGVTAIAFPWIFTSTREVAAVCWLAALALLLIRLIPALRNSVGQMLYTVKRASLGELLFAVAIVMLFHFSDGQRVLYVVPLAVLSISDTFAALVGTHYGHKRFSVVDGNKSWEGTFAFAGATFVVFLVLLAILTDLSWPALILIALTFAILGALVEAISWYGLDNFFVPLATFLFLNAFMGQSEIALFYQLCALIALIMFARISGPKSQLNTHAVMTATVSFYFFWQVGGLIWAISPTVVFLIHIFLVKLQKDEGSYNVAAALSVSSSGFFWLLVAQLWKVPHGFFLFNFALAIHLQIIALLRLKAQRGITAGPWLVLLTSLASATLTLWFPLWVDGVYPQTQNLLVLSVGILFIGGVFTGIHSDRFSRQRWVNEAILALLGSVFLLMVL